jgi:hypothetical protein
VKEAGETWIKVFVETMGRAGQERTEPKETIEPATDSIPKRASRTAGTETETKAETETKIETKPKGVQTTIESRLDFLTKMYAASKEGQDGDEKGGSEED